MANTLYAEGNPNGNVVTPDGVHPNSYGHYIASIGMVAYRNGVAVTDPFAT
jgi:hypothetical protein